MEYVYILRCRDDTLYTGWTNNLSHRLKSHQAAKGARYTKTRVPVHLVYFEVYAERSEALRREYQIKQLSRAQKNQLIANFDPERLKEFED